MILQFRIGTLHSIIDYEVVFDYSRTPFNFTDDAGHNTDLISQRLAAVDAVDYYRLVASTPVTWQDSRPFYLDCEMHFLGNNEDLYWILRPAQVNLAAETYATIKVWTDALRPIVIGTVTAHRAQVHAEAKEAIRNQARQQAIGMLEMSRQIFQFLTNLIDC